MTDWNWSTFREHTRQQEQLIASLRSQIADQRAAMKLIEAAVHEGPASEPEPQPVPRPSLWQRLTGGW